jgi:hypothetical protein
MPSHRIHLPAPISTIQLHCTWPPASHLSSPLAIYVNKDQSVQACHSLLSFHLSLQSRKQTIGHHVSRTRAPPKVACPTMFILFYTYFSTNASSSIAITYSNHPTYLSTPTPTQLHLLIPMFPSSITQRKEKVLRHLTSPCQTKVQLCRLRRLHISNTISVVLD